MCVGVCVFCGWGQRCWRGAAEGRQQGPPDKNPMSACLPPLSASAHVRRRRLVLPSPLSTVSTVPRAGAGDTPRLRLRLRPGCRCDADAVHIK